MSVSSTAKVLGDSAIKSLTSTIAPQLHWWMMLVAYDSVEECPGTSSHFYIPGSTVALASAL